MASVASSIHSLFGTSDYEFSAHGQSVEMKPFLGVYLKKLAIAVKTLLNRIGLKRLSWLGPLILAPLIVWFVTDAIGQSHLRAERHRADRAASIAAEQASKERKLAAEEARKEQQSEDAIHYAQERAHEARDRRAPDYKQLAFIVGKYADTLRPCLLSCDTGLILTMQHQVSDAASTVQITGSPRASELASNVQLTLDKTPLEWVRFRGLQRQLVDLYHKEIER